MLFAKLYNGLRMLRQACSKQRRLQRWQVHFAGEAAREASHGPDWLQRWGIVLVGLLAAVLFLTQMHQPLLDPDEGRQAEIAREMLSRGDWLVPYYRGEPYFEKPPLQYWLTAILYATLGVTPAVARLLPALAACATVLVTFAWGRRHVGTVPAFLGSLILCLTPGFVLLGRMVLLDSLLTLCVTSALFLAHAAMCGPRFRVGLWLLSGVIAGIGVLQKGPVSVVLFVAPVGVFAWLRPARTQPDWRSWLAWLGLVGIIAAPWYLAISLTHAEYAHRFLWRANVLRYVQPFDHQQPWWYYVPVLLFGCWPWSALWPVLLALLASKRESFRKLRTESMGFLALPALWCFAFFSLSGCKSPPYLMPMLPAVALLTGCCLNVLLFQGGTHLGSIWRWLGKAGPLTGTAFLALVPPILAIGFHPTHMLPVLGYGLVTATLLGLLIWFHRHGSAVHAWTLLAATMAFTILLPFRNAVWELASRRTPQAIVARTRPLWQTVQPVVLFNRDWPSAHFYCSRDKLPVFLASHRDRLVVEVERCLLDGQPSIVSPDAADEVVVLVNDDEYRAGLLALLRQALAVEVHEPAVSTQPELWIVRRGTGSGAGSRWARARKQP